jgi:hypothetical protein
MGVIQCQKHGNQILSFVSPKIAAYVRNGLALEFPISKIILNLDDGKKSTFFVDDDFAKNVCREYHLDLKKIVLESEEDSFEVFCSLEGVCEICLENFVRARELE